MPLTSGPPEAPAPLAPIPEPLAGVEPAVPAAFEPAAFEPAPCEPADPAPDGEPVPAAEPALLPAPVEPVPLLPAPTPVPAGEFAEDISVPDAPAAAFARM